jgi:hypothetical protein
MFIKSFTIQVKWVTIADVLTRMHRRIVFCTDIL